MNYIMISSEERAIVDHMQKYAKLVSKDFACHLLNLVFHLVRHRMTLVDKCHHQCVKALNFDCKCTNGDDHHVVMGIQNIPVFLCSRPPHASQSFQGRFGSRSSVIPSCIGIISFDIVKHFPPGLNDQGFSHFCSY
jgi:hypothetical protein